MEPGLSLYQFPGCPYCQRVRDALKRLKLDVEMRDITAQPQHRDELVRATGRGTVPVLRIEDTPGAVRWLPESLDIIRYLEERAAR
jgi:glutathione S-transferase